MLNVSLPASSILNPTDRNPEPRHMWNKLCWWKNGVKKCKVPYLHIEYKNTYKLHSYQRTLLASITCPAQHNTNTVFFVTLIASLLSSSIADKYEIYNNANAEQPEIQQVNHGYYK